MTKCADCEEDPCNCRRWLRPREFDVLNLIAAGKTNLGAAKELGISVKTVEVHLNGAKKALRAKTTRQLMFIYGERGLQRP